MIKSLILSSFVSTALLLSGCGKTEAPAAQAAAPAVPAGPRVIEVTGNDQMKFSVTRIEAKAGEQLKIVFTNVGTLPKQAMGHNLVILNKGVDAQAFANAALAAAATDYLPPALSGQVLAATKVLGPKESQELVFTVPAEVGEYPFICSFTAHYLVGMRGVMVVQ